MTTSKGSSDAAVLRKCVRGVELDSLVTEVKDILPHLGDGFVEVNTFFSVLTMCLTRESLAVSARNYSSMKSVISGSAGKLYITFGDVSL